MPKYKEIVKKPMDLGLMREKCKKMVYQSAKAFLEDMNQIVENARAFNSSPDVQWVVQHAELLQEVAIEQTTHKSDEITAAEEAIAQQKSEMKVPSQARKRKREKRVRHRPRALAGRTATGHERNRKPDTMARRERRMTGLRLKASCSR